MSSKPEPHSLESAVSLISDFAGEFKRQTPGRLQVKGLTDTFCLLKEEKGRGPWIVVEATALDRYPVLRQCLQLAAPGGSRSCAYRYEKFLRFELNKNSASQVIKVLQTTLLQRQYLKLHFKVE